MAWIETSETKQLQARYGHHLIVKTLEYIAPNTSGKIAEPTWPTDSFDREVSWTDGKHVARYSLYEPTGEAEYLIRGALSQEPLETHYKWNKGDTKIEQAEWKKYKKWKDDPSSTTWKPDGSEATENFKKFYAFIERGVEYFLSATVEMQVTELVNNTPVLSKLGTIDPPQNAPTLPRNRDWLIVSIDAEKIGKKWRQTTTFRASGDGGWDNNLYKFS